VDTLQPRCAAPTADWCGEGPVWCAEEQALYWVDINRSLVHRLDCDGAVRSWFFDEPVTALALTGHSGTLAVVLASRLVYWTVAQDARRDHGWRLPDAPAARCNDARPDPRGSLWIGSMRNNIAPDGSALQAGGTDGALYRIDPDGAVAEIKGGIGVANTLCWSPDRTRFYFADTLRNTIYAYDDDAGAISNERPFFAAFDRGFPDGSAMDRDGFLWNCRWGGACIVRIAPTGEIDTIVEMPVRNVTSCTFGGPDLRTLYITSASLGAPPDRRAGSLFTLQTPVPGLPENRFL
jgi:sugar lactone lactonase YvrE